MIAELGYVGFALDMYGKGKIGNTDDEKAALMNPFIENRTMIPKRIDAALATAKSLPMVDGRYIGAIGFCFGGLCVLDFVRSGASILGAVSFHGLLNAPKKKSDKPMQAKVLVCHGYDDPSVKPDQVIAFANEMTEAKVDWQIMMYGHTVHAFTNPKAAEPALGRRYNKKADVRSWIAMKDFFKEVFGK